MTRLSELKDKLIIKNVETLGDTWHNEKVELLFKDVPSNNFSLDVMNYVIEHLQKGDEMRSIGRVFSKGQLQKLNVLCRAKSDKARNQRARAFAGLLTNGVYSGLFNRKLIEGWVQFCDKHHLEHGLVKVDRAQQMEQMINDYFG